MPARVSPPIETVSARQIDQPQNSISSHRYDLGVLLVLCAAVFLLCCLSAATKPLWFDEIASAHIAGAPTWHEMLWRSRAIDLHPPLYPALTRLSFYIFGPNEFAGRFVSIVAHTVAVGAVFLFLRRRTSLLFATFGALLLLCNADVVDYGTNARPYALLFAAVCVGVLAYDSVTSEKHTPWARLVLGLSIVVMLQTHLFGTFAAAAFVLAEAVRTARLRKLDLGAWAAVLLPWLSCITYIPLLRIQVSSPGSPMVFWRKDRTSLIKGALFYHKFLYIPLAPLTKIVAVALLCVRFFPSKSFARYFGLTLERATLLFLILCSPLFITLLLHFRAPETGFYPRYGIAAVCPAFLLAAGLVAWRSGDSQGLAILCILVAFAGTCVAFPNTLNSLKVVAHQGFLAAPPGASNTGGVEKLCPELPLAMNDAFEFLEADYELGPGKMDRMIYVSDPAESVRLEGENVSNSVVGMARAFHLPHHTTSGQQFFAAHPSFLLAVLPGKTGWLLDELHEQNARMKLLGRYDYARQMTDIWLVSQANAATTASSSCAVPASAVREQR